MMMNQRKGELFVTITYYLPIFPLFCGMVRVRDSLLRQLPKVLLIDEREEHFVVVVFCIRVGLEMQMQKTVLRQRCWWCGE